MNELRFSLYVEGNHLDRFLQGKLFLQKAWPRMALRDLRAFGRAWDLVVERAGDQQKVTVRSGGRTLMTGSGLAGKTYSVSFTKGIEAPTVLGTSREPEAGDSHAK